MQLFYINCFDKFHHCKAKFRKGTFHPYVVGELQRSAMVLLQARVLRDSLQLVMLIGKVVETGR